MPQSLARVVLHVIFSTKNRVPFLTDLELRARLHAYIAGLLQTIGCEPILIGGVEDHVHIVPPRWGLGVWCFADPGRRSFLACPGLAC